jgi:hypothetical protein
VGRGRKQESTQGQAQITGMSLQHRAILAFYLPQLGAIGRLFSAQ